MKRFRTAAMAGVFVTAAGLLSAATAAGQRRDPVVRAIESGRGSRLGITVEEMEDADARQRVGAGVLVQTVEPGGPADKAGLKSGDAITEFDGEKVRGVRQFSRLVQETPAGRGVPLVLARGTERMTLTVTPQRSTFGDDFAVRLLEAPMALPPRVPDVPPSPRPPSPPVPPLLFDGFRYGSGPRLGIAIESLDDQLAQYFGVKDGVLVKSVREDSAARQAGLKAGDVITSVNGRRVYDASDITRAIDRMESSNEFTLEIVRDRKPQTLKGKLEGRGARF